MKEFIKENKAKILKILSLLMTLLIISIIALVILVATKVIYYENGLQFNAELFNGFKNKWYGFIVFILIQTILTVILCFIPGVSMAFIMICGAIYSNPLTAFLISFASVMLSSMFMYLIGRFGGYKICERIVGEEDLAKATKLIREKSTIYFPLMMMFPLFPDDALVMLAGTTKMKLSWFIPSIVFGRGIGIATTIFGISIVPFEKFTSAYDWIIFITIVAFWIFAIFKLAHKANVWIDSKRKKKNSSNYLNCN